MLVEHDSPVATRFDNKLSASSNNSTTPLSRACLNEFDVLGNVTKVFRDDLAVVHLAELFAPPQRSSRVWTQLIQKLEWKLRFVAKLLRLKEIPSLSDEQFE
jgi:hypothetical protein